MGKGCFDCDDGDYAERETCCGKLMRCWLTTANLVTIVLGLAEIALGIWALVDASLAFLAGPLAWSLVVGGLFIFLISFLGVYAGCAGERNDRVMYIYAFFLTLIIGAQVAVVVLVIMNQEFAADSIQTGWDKYTNENKDTVGLSMGCCKATVAGAIGDKYDCAVKGTTNETRYMAMCDVYPYCTDKTCENYGFVTPSGNAESCTKIAYAEDKATCAAYVASTMPECISQLKVTRSWYSFAGGEVSADIYEPLVNCYAKAENSYRKYQLYFIIGAVVYPLWQLILVVFAWLLACDCMNKKTIPM